MEEAQKGIWMGVGIFFFVAAFFVTVLYLGKIQKLETVLNTERERTYLIEEAGEDKRFE